MFLEYANRKEICNSLSPYKIGDTVVLYNQLSNPYGMYTAGTEMIIDDITVAYDIRVPTNIPRNEIDDYTIAGEKVFRYTLKHEESNQTVDCFERDIYKKGSTKNDLNITINTIGKVSKSAFKISSIISIILVILLDIIFLINNDYNDWTKTAMVISGLAFINIVYYSCLGASYVFFYGHKICKKIDVHNQYIIHR